MVLQELFPYLLFYLENNIGYKDNIDWTVVKQADELSIASPSQADQNEQNFNSTYDHSNSQTEFADSEHQPSDREEKQDLSQSSQPYIATCQQ